MGANILFLIYSLLKYLVNGKTALDFFYVFLNSKTLLKFVLLNESPFGGHLWYLGAIFYVLIIIICVEKVWSREKLYPFIPFLLLTDLILGKYSLLVFERQFSYILVRNFLCVGLPYFLIGDILFKIKYKIKSRNLKLYTILFMFTTLLERFVLGVLNLNATRDHYFSTTFLAVSVFWLAENYWDMGENYIYKKCCFIGAKLTTSIYIIHPIFIDAISVVEEYFIYNALTKIIYGYVSPFLIFLISIIVSWVIYNISRRVKNRRDNCKHKGHMLK